MPVSSLPGKIVAESSELFENLKTEKISYSGDKTTALAHTTEIRSWLGRLDKTEGTTLRLVKSGKNVSGQETYTLKRHRWFHDFCFWAPDAKKNANEFIKSLFEKTYPLQQADSKTAQEAEEKFSSYLTANSQKKEVTIADVKNLLDALLEMQTTADSSETSTATASSGGSDDAKKYIPFAERGVTQVGYPRSQPTTEISKAVFATRTFQESIGVTIDLDKTIGAGSFGSVHQAWGPNHEEYVFKIENKPALLLEDSNFDDEKWWRDCDFAASRIELRNMVKTVLVVIQVTTNKNTTYYSLPPEKAKEFGKKLRDTNPEAKVSVVAQLMEKAPGEMLSSVINKTDGLDPDSSDFRDLLNGCCAYIEDAHYSNVVHLDIKPNNMMFQKRTKPDDPKTSVLTIIDGGFSKRGARKYIDENNRTPKTRAKANSFAELTNPASFQRLWGTMEYSHPKVLKNYYRKKTNYSTEVNSYSFGVTLLEAISPTEFWSGKYAHPNKENSFEKKQKDVNADPTTYLDRYLTALGLNSTTAKLVNKNPEIKNLLELTFQLSGDDAENVFPKWQQAYHAFQEKWGYEVKTDFTKKTKS